ncbi:Glucokinase [Ignavibacterium album JCM 16511]|uniref:Glucokinase n=1 Tax=Ignavibacterium album (strain DSM 19864 / JCM 16511 / NBRC 101810 / Mat9-16) TaxID=945713 RepID=I0AL15_IGNAJ|nr:glucokinase [Ignavibacterium album]AFH49672.1 Glucokinase [Ignavibacterium album JCM 16511]
MESNKIILAGDVGGTKTLLALYECSGSHWIELKSKKYSSTEFANLELIVKDFLESQQISPASAVFGIPGPVEHGVVKSTNLPWIVDEKLLSKNLHIPKVKIVNDLAATAYQIPFLKEEEKILIKETSNEKRSERFVVVAPGTGLGQALLICEDDKKIVLASEGGHIDFAPTNELELELLHFLLKKFERVSYERIISGSGLPNIYDFLVESKFARSEEETIGRMKTEDRAIVISEMALAQKDKVCEKALEIFASVLGAHSGNLVINLLATGGVYLGGGIPHKILSKLKDGVFIKSFVNKGRLNPIVEETPVYVINNNLAALQGAARIAESLI